MNFKKRLLSLFLLIFMLYPTLVFAYSNKIILGGNNIGIKVNTKNVMIVGFYKVEDRFIGEDAGLKVGDLILKINNKEVSSITDMVNIINNLNNKDSINITIKRNNKELDFNLKLFKDKNNIYKTGLYVKDQINGIGTLTYIDPTTNIFGALGHEISDKNTLKKVEIKDGMIFKSEITGITPSYNGNPGSKNARLYTDIIYGNIDTNSIKGIYGKINEDFNNNDIIEVANYNEIKLGDAKIRTVLEDNIINEYLINIIDIDNTSETKNILFEIIDKDLLNKTGGVIAGMSGSPIIQNNKIIGAVTHVVVDQPKKGYGIFITNMLEEGDRKSR